MFSKKSVFIFLAAFLVLLGAFLYIGSEKMLESLKGSLEKSLSDAFGAQAKIGSLKSNILNRVVIRDLNLDFGYYDINLDAAYVEYSLRDAIFRKRVLAGKEVIIYFKNGSLKIGGTVVSKDIVGRIRLDKDNLLLDSMDIKLFGLVSSRISGTAKRKGAGALLDLEIEFKPLLDSKNAVFQKADIKINGQLGNMAVKGSIKRPDKPDIPIEAYAVSSGEIFRFELKTDASALVINSDYLKQPLKIDIITNHIKLGGADFSNIVHLSLKANASQDGVSSMAVDIDTESTILNYYPFEELQASFWASKDIIRIIYFKLGNIASAYGVIFLKDDPRILFKARLNDFDIAHPSLVPNEETTPIATGKLSGNISIEGPLSDIKTKAALEAKKGFLGTIDYEKLILNLEGQGPFLNIYDSRLIRQDSFLIIDGSIDTKRVGTYRFLEDVRVTSDENTVLWEGWDITKRLGSDELKLKKDLRSGVSVGFKTYIENETAYESTRGQDELAVEYKVPDKNGSIQLKSKESEEFVGVVKKYKF